MAHSSPEVGKCVLFYFSLVCVRDCCVSFRVGEMFRKGNSKLQAFEVCHEQNTTFYQRAFCRFYLSTSLFVERGYTMNFSISGTNIHLQKQEQAKDSSSEFTIYLNETVLETRQSNEAEGDIFQRSGWQRLFLLWQMERKAGNSSVVKHKRVLRKKSKFPPDITFTKLVFGFSSLPSCRDRD